MSKFSVIFKVPENDNRPLFRLDDVSLAEIFRLIKRSEELQDCVITLWRRDTND